jgi:DNA-binding response OmpR family regulator
MTSVSQRRKVLIIEDEPSIRKLLHALVEKLGCENAVATDGQQALAMISRKEFDAVLLDLRCSSLQPDNVVAEIYEMRPSLIGRILVITGEVSDAKTLDLIERHFLLEVPHTRLLQDLVARLRVLLRLAPSPNRAAIPNRD